MRILNILQNTPTVLPQTPAEGMNILFWLCILFHFIDAFLFNFRRGYTMGGFTMAAAYLIVFIIAIVVLSSMRGGFSWEIFGTSFGLSFLAYMMPYFAYYLWTSFGVFTSMPLVFVNGVIFFFPVWLVYFFITRPTDTIGVAAAIYAGIWLSLFFLVFATNYGQIAGYVQTTVGLAIPSINLKEMHLNPYEPIQAVLNLFWESGKNFLTRLKAGYLEAKGKAQQFYNSTVGQDYYTGTVDQNADKRLGVFIGNIEKASTAFYSDEQIDLWASVEVRTLPDADITEAKMTCSAKKDDVTKKASNIYPETTDNLVLIQDIDCQFKPKELGKGTWSIALSADFNFPTLAYQKMYFIERQRYLSLRRAQTDPLDQYGISDKNPLTIYTNGPVMVGMDTRNPLKDIGLEGAENSPMVLGITIDNKWEGELKGINEMTVIMPKALEFEGTTTAGEATCKGYKFKRVQCDPDAMKQICDPNINTVYILDDEIKLKEGERLPMTFRCPLEIKEPAELLSDAPITTQYFKVMVNYNYMLERKTSITVKKGLTDTSTDDSSGSSQGTGSTDQGSTQPSTSLLLGSCTGRSEGQACLDSNDIPMEYARCVSGVCVDRCVNVADGKKCVDESGNEIAYTSCYDDKCMDTCEYLAKSASERNDYSRVGWSCSCTLAECNTLGDQCAKGECRGTSYCCKK